MMKLFSDKNPPLGLPRVSPITAYEAHQTVCQKLVTQGASGFVIATAARNLAEHLGYSLREVMDIPHIDPVLMATPPIDPPQPEMVS